MRIWLVVSIILLASCAAQRLRKEQAEMLGKFGTGAPPGAIAVDDSLYCDRTEVTNISWLEYEYWVTSTFGYRSPEHVSMLPDTMVWDRVIEYDEPYRLAYLRHPAYRDHPVVGVTYAQAKAYCEWRSDRVMESYLIRTGVIDFRKEQTAQDHFTIEAFYGTDGLKAYHHLPYPSYALPTYAEWRGAVAMADSMARVNLPRCKKLKSTEFRGASFGECSGLVQQGRFIINSREVSVHAGSDKVAPTYCSRCEEDLIWHLRGNVSELSIDSALVLGGGWTDPLDSILLDIPLPTHVPHVATGFRSVCRWRVWDGVRR